jgi:NADPH:quinone reductase-like Zn-dependent oxidoreductase
VRVVQFARFGDPAEVLEVVERPDPPAPGAGEVRLAFEAAPINPSDLLTVRGEYGTRPELPATPGYEGVGRVEAVGEGVRHLAPGDRVLPMTVRGTWRSAAVVGAARLFALPEADPLQLAMLTANPPTALLMLELFAPLAEGDWVVQNAANSGVGAAVIAAARERGVRTLNVVRRESAVAEVEALGGDAVLVDGPDLAGRARPALEAAGAHARTAVKLGIDAVGGRATARLARCVADGGTVVSYGSMSEEACVIEPRETIFRDVSLRGFWLTRWIAGAQPGELARVFGTVGRMVAEGRLRVPVAATYPLSRAREACAHAARGERGGKVLLVAD